MTDRCSRNLMPFAACVMCVPCGPQAPERGSTGLRAALEGTHDRGGLLFGADRGARGQRTVVSVGGTMAMARLRRRLGRLLAVVDTAAAGSGPLGFSEERSVCARSFGCGMLVSSLFRQQDHRSHTPVGRGRSPCRPRSRSAHRAHRSRRIRTAEDRRARRHPRPAHSKGVSPLGPSPPRSCRHRRRPRRCRCPVDGMDIDLDTVSGAE